MPRKRFTNEQIAFALRQPRYVRKVETFRSLPRFRAGAERMRVECPRYPTSSRSIAPDRTSRPQEGQDRRQRRGWEPGEADDAVAAGAARAETGAQPDEEAADGENLQGSNEAHRRPGPGGEGEDRLTGDESGIDPSSETEISADAGHETADSGDAAVQEHQERPQ